RRKLCARERVTVWLCLHDIALVCLQRARRYDAGSVAHSIERAGFLPQADDFRSDRVVLHEIDPEPPMLCAAQHRRGCRQPLLVAPHEYDAGSAAGEVDGDRAPKPGGSAGHHTPPAAEIKKRTGHDGRPCGHSAWTKRASGSRSSIVDPQDSPTP